MINFDKFNRVNTSKLTLDMAKDIRYLTSAFCVDHFIGRDGYSPVPVRDEHYSLLEQEMLILLHVIKPVPEKIDGGVLVNSGEYWYAMSDIHELPIARDEGIAARLIMPEDTDYIYQPAGNYFSPTHMFVFKNLTHIYIKSNGERTGTYNSSKVLMPAHLPRPIAFLTSLAVYLTKRIEKRTEAKQAG